MLSQGGRLTLAGIVIGLLGSTAGSGLLRALLFEIGPNDPATLVGVGVLLAVVACAACLVPAMRAARVDPSRALRSD